MASKLRQIGTILLAVGGTGTAGGILWWLLFYGSAATESAAGFGALVECLLHTTKECQRRQMIMPPGFPAYQPMLLWVSSIVFMAGAMMKVLAPANAHRVADLIWPHIVSTWWLLVWRGTIGYIVLDVILRLAGDYLEMATDWSPRPIERVASATAVALGVFWLIPVVFMALRKHYSDYRLVLTSPGDNAPLAITGRRVIEIWRILIWRFILGGIVLGLVAAWLTLAAIILHGSSIHTLVPWVLIGANLTALIWSVVVTRIAIEVTYSDFRIAIVPRLQI
jgi:hypothetical protein